MNVEIISTSEGEDSTITVRLSGNHSFRRRFMSDFACAVNQIVTNLKNEKIIPEVKPCGCLDAEQRSNS